MNDQAHLDSGFLCFRMTHEERVKLHNALQDLLARQQPEDKPSWEAYWATQFVRVLKDLF